MAVNTWDGSSSTDWGTAANWTTTGVTDRVPTADDDVVIPDCSSINNCILDGDTTINSLELQGSSNFSMNNHDLTIDGENGSGRAIDVGSSVTFVGGTGTLIFTLGSGTTKLQGLHHLSDSTELRNVQFNGAATFNIENDTTINGNLTISAGTLTTLDSDGSTSRNLTVTGKTSVNAGTLTCNASTISLGASYTADYALEITGGTFVGGSGTHTLGSLYMSNTSAAVCTLTSGVTSISSEVTSANEAIKITGTNAVFNHGSGTVTHTTTANTKYIRTGSALSLNNFIQNNNSNIQVSPSLTCAGNFTLTAGEFDTSGSNYAVTVTGDAAINAGQFVGNASAISFGSLTIASGATYLATSGTTTITGKNSSNYMFQNSGTFTHNKGTVKFKADTSSGTWAGQNSTNNESTVTKFYNFETEATGSASSYRFWYGGNSFYLVVLGNLTIGAGTSIYSGNGTSILRHYGSQFNINGTALFDNVTNVECGFITIGSAGKLEFDEGDQAISCTGIRNLRGSAGIQA